MTITLTIEDDPVSGEPKAEFTFDPPLLRSEVDDPTPAQAIALGIMGWFKDRGGRIEVTNGEA